VLWWSDVRRLLFVLLAACVPPASQIEDAAPPLDAEADAGGFDALPDAAADADAAGDAGLVEDGGIHADAEPPDSGAPSHCPTDVNPACSSSAACGTDIPPPSNCEACVVANDALCAGGACETPPVLDSADIYGIATQVDPTIPLLESIGAFAVASRTAGDATISCADVYLGTIDLEDRCYNVLDSSSVNVSQTGDTYTVTFNGFTSGQRTLFIIYGFENTGARGPPAGVSCTEIDVGPPMGGSTEFFAGDPMRPL
jgi:hypothetical protein